MSLVTAFLAPLMRTSPRSGPVGSIFQVGVVVVGEGVGGGVTRQSCHRVDGPPSLPSGAASPDRADEPVVRRGGREADDPTYAGPPVVAGGPEGDPTEL